MPPQPNRTQDKRPKLAVLYLRVSTLGQVNTDYDPEGNSIPAQRKAGRQKAAALGAKVVEEFVEPGKTATSIHKRPEFQKMMAWVKDHADSIDYIIVYHFNRIFRNSIDAAITKRELSKYGVRVVSTILDLGETPESSLVESIIHAVDQYQSEASGADIAYKMSQKVERGGSIGRAKLGYRNVREKFDGREVRTVAVDPERSPFVRIAFELFATGTYSEKDLADALTDAGLRMMPTKRHPAGARISVHKVGQMLRDRYYLGYVTHKGVEYKGRHEPIIDQELFDRVQKVLNDRARDTRKRTHDHYLKGTPWCRRCRRRLILMPGTSKNGIQYFYFICRGRQDHICNLPYLPVAVVENAVERHYATIAIPTETRTRITHSIDNVIADNNSVNDERRSHIKKQLAELNRREDQYLDLVGDPDWSKEKLTERIRKLRDEQNRLQQQLDHIENPDFDTGRAALNVVLDLLTSPDKLYRLANKRARRILNQALFTRLYIDVDDTGPTVTTHEPTEPFAPLLDAYTAQEHDSGDIAQPGDTAADQKPSTLLHTALRGQCSSNAPWVELRGFEPLTPSMRTRCATGLRYSPKDSARLANRPGSSRIGGVVMHC
jgi:site-specific DNA recombinase